MIKFFHHLFNPHCADCYSEIQENKICASCETYKSELAALRYQNEQLMKSILEIVHPVKPRLDEQQQVDFKPLNTSWRVKKQMLEENDRRAAQVLRDKKNEIYETPKTTEQLEKELLGEDNAREIGEAV